MPIEDKIAWPRLDGAPGPALPLTEDSARRRIAEVLANAPAATRRATPARRMARTVLLVAVALLVAASALALYRRYRPPPPPPTPATAQGPLVPARGAPPALSTPSIPREPALASTPAPKRAPLRPDVAPPDTGVMLEHANELRAQRRWVESEALYEQVLRLAPSLPAAQAARVAAGELRLGPLGDPSGAERLFGAADRRGGPLSEEAAWGIAEARRALGDGHGERAALEDFVRRFPFAAMAPRARTRLAEIAPAP